MLNQTSLITAGWFGDDETTAEFQYRLLDGDRVELIALVHCPDAASGRSYTFEAGHKITEREYGEDEATDLEYETRAILEQMGVNGWATGRFSESVAAAIDATTVEAWRIAAE
jgi:hypothetical protein